MATAEGSLARGERNSRADGALSMRDSNDDDEAGDEGRTCGLAATCEPTDDAVESSIDLTSPSCCAERCLSALRRHTACGAVALCDGGSDDALHNGGELVLLDELAATEAAADARRSARRRRPPVFWWRGWWRELAGTPSRSRIGVAMCSRTLPSPDDDMVAIRRRASYKQHGECNSRT